MKLQYLIFWLILITLVGVVLANSGNVNSQSNNPVLEQAEKSLAANQKQLTILSTPNSIDESSQASSKIIRSTGSMSTYENSDYGIRINFPNSWKSSEVNLATFAIVAFVAPELDPNSIDYVPDPAYLSVASEKLSSKNMTLPQFIESFLRDNFNATEYRIISASKSSLAGLVSEKVITYEYVGISTKVMRNFVIDPKTDTV